MWRGACAMCCPQQLEPNRIAGNVIFERAVRSDVMKLFRILQPVFRAGIAVAADECSFDELVRYRLVVSVKRRNAQLSFGK